MSALELQRRNGPRTIYFHRSITIRRSAADIHRLWRDLERLPAIFEHVDSVQAVGAGSRWRAHLGPMHATWEVDVIDEEPGRRIVWRTRPDSEWLHDGEIELAPAPGERGTELHVWLRVVPRGRQTLLHWLPLGQRLAHVRLGQELRRFKQWAETGEIAVGASRPEPRPRETHPELLPAKEARA